MSSLSMSSGKTASAQFPFRFVHQLLDITMKTVLLYMSTLGHVKFAVDIIADLSVYVW